MNESRRAFTLMEVLIVVVLIGILAGAGTASFWQSRRNSLQRNARNMLTLMQAAEETLFSEINSYATNGCATVATCCNSTATCNVSLRLSIPTPATPDYNYRATATNGFTVCAVNNANGLQDFFMRRGDAAPTAGACP